MRGVLFPEDMDDIFSPLAVSQTMSLSGIEKLLKNGRRQVREGTHDTCKLLALALGTLSGNVLPSLRRTRPDVVFLRCRWLVPYRVTLQRRPAFVRYAATGVGLLTRHAVIRSGISSQRRLGREGFERRGIFTCPVPSKWGWCPASKQFRDDTVTNQASINSPCCGTKILGSRATATPFMFSIVQIPMRGYYNFTCSHRAQTATTTCTSSV